MRDTSFLHLNASIACKRSGLSHVISVDELGFAKLKTFEVQAEAGKTYFVEYDSSKGLLLGLGLLSSSASKTESQALADLKDLRRAN